MKISQKKLLTCTFIVFLSSGCITTGISIGPVFIPVNTGIGDIEPIEKDPKKKNEMPSGAPKPKATPVPQETQEEDCGVDTEKDCEPENDPV
ncbi:MAG: hypothetical protein HRT35_13730 [Algicola sp.]|nr:hypothetical protein [Algicola sp.]